jgi:nitrite reductase (NADH) large subunit
MERQLDDVAGKMLQKSLEERGMQFLMGAQTQELVGNDAGRVPPCASRTAPRCPPTWW